MDTSTANIASFRIQSIAPPVMKGSLLKRGSFRPNWKTRFVVLERGRLIYFEPSHWLQVGERDLTSFVIEEPSGSSADNIIVIKCSQHKHSTLILKLKTKELMDLWIASLNAHIAFAHLIANDPILLLRIAQKVMSGDRGSLAVKKGVIEHQQSVLPGNRDQAENGNDEVKDDTNVSEDDIDDVEEKDAETTASHITVTVDENNCNTPGLQSTSTTTTEASHSSSRLAGQQSSRITPPPPAEPPIMKGWILKQGHIVKNWKKRYCIVERGELRYYSVFRSPQDASKFDHILKGQLKLGGYSVAHDNITGATVSRDNHTKGPGHIILRPNRFLSKALLLSVENDLDWLMWSAALCLHIQYANEVVAQTVARHIMPAAVNDNEARGRRASLSVFGLSALNWTSNNNNTNNSSSASDAAVINQEVQGVVSNEAGVRQSRANNRGDDDQVTASQQQEMTRVSTVSTTTPGHSTAAVAGESDIQRRKTIATSNYQPPRESSQSRAAASLTEGWTASTSEENSSRTTGSVGLTEENSSSSSSSSHKQLRFAPTHAHTYIDPLDTNTDIGVVANDADGDHLLAEEENELASPGHDDDHDPVDNNDQTEADMAFDFSLIGDGDLNLGEGWTIRDSITRQPYSSSRKSGRV